MIATKKILAFLILMVISTSFVGTIPAETEEEEETESGVRLVPSEKVQVTEGYVDTLFKANLSNFNEDGSAFTDVKYTIDLDYGVPFEITSIDRGDFDDAVIVDIDTVLFEASYQGYGWVATGQAGVRLEDPEETCEFNAYWKVDLKHEDSGVTVKLEEDEQCIFFNPFKFFPWLWNKVKDALAGETESGVSVPEFPAGNSFALFIAMVVLLTFFWRKGRRRYSPLK